MCESRVSGVDARVVVRKAFVPRAEAKVVFAHLVERADALFTQGAVRVPFQKKLVPEARLTAFWGDDSAIWYHYSGKRQTAAPWPTHVREICARVNEALGTRFNSCLANFYRKGADHISWHSDNEADLLSPEVVSVSLGGERKFSVKPRRDAPAGVVAEFARRYGRIAQVVLGSGDLCAMTGASQRIFQHAVLKCVHAEPRISLTFRECPRAGDNRE